ncbi:hypothetical protein ZIOFF_017141 [Zingiber officinale]|uniref:Xylanase inhibitor N-terminal domain-containing protein n=1 Tax=Zingiber officinale TaxID=94328 RepID=A0A8J5LL36_ZINOF|nr:hypothetical protein ZIOFF_017141 [Zingiber officinale]
MAADTINFELHHKFSARVKEWAASHSGGRDLPSKGTVEFYAAVTHHDRRLHGLLLASSNNSSTVVLAFSPCGNVTTKIDSLGFPSNSSTSQSMPCSSNICPANCPANSSCPYKMLYADGSTTSGVLVADTLYLMAEGGAAPHSENRPSYLGAE